MIPMNKVEITAYRYLGCAGSVFTLFQSCIWLLLYLAAAMCKYVGCGSSGSKRTFKYCFYLLYYYEPQNITANFTRVNYITPTTFHGIMWINVLLCIGNIVISVFTAKAFIQWNDTKVIRKTAYIWTRCILVFSTCELLMFIIFASDVVSIKQKEDVKCFLQINLTDLKSAYTIPRTPAPYLLQLKSKMKTLRRKIRKYNKNLEFLDAVFDEKSPDHVKNPFISKTVVNTYVEDIWKNMFNNSIREKVRRKADAMPNDEMMRNFVINEHLDLDDLDYDLLKNFDGLTNNRWTKPIHSSNMVYGRPFNLSSRITETNDSAELDKITSLLKEYLNDNGMPKTTSYPEPDENFDDLFKDIIDELEQEQETHFVHNKDNVESALDKVDFLANQNDSIISMENEEVLLSLRKFFADMLPHEEEDEQNDQDMEIVMNKIKEFVENNENAGLSDEEIFNKVKHEFGVNKNEKGALNNSRKFKFAKNRDAPYRRGDIQNRRRTTPKPKKKSKLKPTVTSYKNELVQELCENCAYFILAPSIVCMILSLKTGLVWVLNIAVAVLLLYYGSRITLKTLKMQVFAVLVEERVKYLYLYYIWVDLVTIAANFC